MLAIVNAAVTLIANPWRLDRPSDRFPAIVQDFTVIVLFIVIGTVLLREQLLTTSAVGAVVVGFALQDTLGNLFAGLAIQIEKPFRVGQWMQIGDREGQVQEITWRATKLRTKDGAVPDRAEQRHLEGAGPQLLRTDHRRRASSVEVGASYRTPPNDVKAAMLEAIANSPLAMTAPAPQGA